MTPLPAESFTAYVPAEDVEIKRWRAGAGCEGLQRHIALLLENMLQLRTVLGLAAVFRISGESHRQLVGGCDHRFGEE